MSNRNTFRRMALLAAVVFCVFMIPRSASADDADVVTLSFSGTISCGASCADPITGTYSFDPDTDSIVGPWSFNSALGSVSSSGISPFVGTEASSGQGFGGTFQLLDFVSGDSGLQLAFNGADGFDGSVITSALVTLTGTNSDPSMFANEDTGFLTDILSGSTTVISNTPEPSSILLLGLGIAGLLGVCWRRSLARRAAES
jgi:PEP-CTERM motif